MHFVKLEKMVGAQRLARPIFSKRGEVQFKPGENITPAIVSALQAMSLTGAYVLEPAESVPVISDDTIELEKFIVSNTYALMKELMEAVKTHRLRRFEYIVDDIIERFSGSFKTIEFPQTVRSMESFVYMHSVNVAIIAAAIATKLGFSADEKRECVKASLIHDIGKTLIPKNLLDGESEEELVRILTNCQDTGFELIDDLFPDEPKIKGVCVQSLNILQHLRFNQPQDPEHIYKSTEVYLVAEVFEDMSAMSIGGNAKKDTAVSAIKYMSDHPEVFNKKAVKALCEAFSIITTGMSVVLSNGNKALVMTENSSNILCPMVLEFSTNKMIDLNLEDKENGIKIVNAVTNTDERLSVK